MAAIGILVGAGFQDATSKTGVVDITRVVEQSDYGKANQVAFGAMKKSREDLLEFIDNNRVLTNEQATRIRELSLKATPTKEESAELDRLKADVAASYKRWQELSTKTTFLPDERLLLDEYSRRSQTMNEVASRWYREFTNEMQTWADKQKLDSIQKARAAIQDVAKTQGYTVVFEIGVAPYGANDITDAALQAMNAKKQ